MIRDAIRQKTGNVNHGHGSAVRQLAEFVGKPVRSAPPGAFGRGKGENKAVQGGERERESRVGRQGGGAGRGSSRTSSDGLRGAGVKRAKPGGGGGKPVVGGSQMMPRPLPDSLAKVDRAASKEAGPAVPAAAPAETVVTVAREAAPVRSVAAVAAPVEPAAVEAPAAVARERLAAGGSEMIGLRVPKVTAPASALAEREARRGVPAVGTKVADYWGSEYGWFAGEIVAADAELIKIKYSDGETEDRDTEEASMLIGYYTQIYSRIESVLARRPFGLPAAKSLSSMGPEELSQFKAERERFWGKAGLTAHQKACRDYGLWLGGTRPELQARLLLYEAAPFHLGREDFEESGAKKAFWTFSLLHCAFSTVLFLFAMDS